MPFGLLVNELATNAVKFGSLSGPEGHVDVVWTVTKTRLSLMWREHGGPPIEKKPATTGFGMLLITSSAQKVTQKFLKDGMVCKLEFAR